MSQKEAKKSDEKESIDLSESLSKEDKILECAVCLQSLVHPVQLQCRHIFCFLCVKGVAIQSKRCPMCRREIPPDFLDHPDLIQGSVKPSSSSEECAGNLEADSDEACSLASKTQEPRWFYEGRNGWWEYDVRTAQDLEISFSKKESTAEMLIAGFLYTIDFQNMIQYRRNEPNRRRQIKRDVLSNVQNWKGIAGLRPTTSSPAPALDSPSSMTSSGNDLDGLSSGLSALNMAADANSSRDSNTDSATGPSN